MTLHSMGEKVKVIEPLRAQANKTFLSFHPRIRVYSATELQDLVLQGELDLAFGVFHSKKPGLSFKTIGEERLLHYISENHPLWKKRKVTKSDLLQKGVCWVDAVKRSRIELKSEVFISHKSKKMKIGSYTNNLHTAKIILKSGRDVVAFPKGYLKTQSLGYSYKELKGLIPPIILKQEVCFLKDQFGQSPALSFFLKLINDNSSHF